MLSSRAAGGLVPSAGTPCPSGAISALAPDARRPACIRIHVAGRPYYTVPAEVVRAEQLQPGRTIDPDLHERLGRAADQEAALRAALRSLELRSHARAWDRSSREDRKSTRLNSSHVKISYAVFCLKKKNTL